MSEPPNSPVRDAGWYPDPEREHTLRYWDGDAWTDDRAPDLPSTRREEDSTPHPTVSGWTDENGRLTALGRYGLGVGLAAVGAIIAIVGVFLPLADTESSLHIAKNSLIQHWEGPVVICVALAGFLSALHPRTRPLAFLAGGALVILAVVAGTNLPIEYRNEFSRAVAGDASPGAGIWTVGAGGAILALSALFGDWGALTGSRDPEDGSGRSRMARFEEVMSGREALDDTGDSTSASADEGASDEETADEVEPSTLRPKGRRMRRFEEIMSGRQIPDPEAEAEPESADPEQ
jgi:hypothetical protein